MPAWWDEWSSYRPSDFLLFSARTYHRLFELYNAEMWPAHVLVLALGVGLLLALMRRHAPAPSSARFAFAMLAVAWLWIAWAFHWQRYADINWAATWFAAGFALQGLLLLPAALMRWGWQRGPRGAAGLLILAFSILVHPWLTPLITGRPWREAELFGLAPDPTALGTVGLLLLMRPSSRSAAARLLGLLLWPIPVLWCLIGAMTQWTLWFQGQGG